MYRAFFIFLNLLVLETRGEPQFLHVGTNIKRMTPKSSSFLKFSAIVTHPDGVKKIIGGVLIDPTSNATYGAFVSQAEEGAYQISLEWYDIEYVRPINSKIGGSARAFVLRFFDEYGKQAETSVDVVFACEDSHLGLCDGKCQDLLSNQEHCGECDRSLDAFERVITEKASQIEGVKLGYKAVCANANPSIYIIKQHLQPATCNQVCHSLHLSCGKKLNDIGYGWVSEMAIGYAHYSEVWPEIEMRSCDVTPSPESGGQPFQLQGCGCFLK